VIAKDRDAISGAEQARKMTRQGTFSSSPMG